MIPYSRDRRAIIETIAILAVFIVTAALLTVRGERQRVFAATPRALAINAPSFAFPLWHDQGLRGRILVLFDRRLNASTTEPEYSLFTESDFAAPGTLDTFCTSLRTDGILGPHQTCSVVLLNGLLKKRHLYARLRTKKSLKIDPEVRRRIRSAAGFRPSYEVLTPNHQSDLLHLNRDMLEAAYSACPRGREFGLTAGNYVFLAIKYSIVRKIYHIIPDESWDEIRQNLAAFPAALVTDRGYRLAAAEGTPVMIMRLRDLPMLTEPVLVNINADLWSPDERRQIASTLNSGRISPDIVTISGKTAPDITGRLHELR